MNTFYLTCTHTVLVQLRWATKSLKFFNLGFIIVPKILLTSHKFEKTLVQCLDMLGHELKQTNLFGVIIVSCSRSDGFADFWGKLSF